MAHDDGAQFAQILAAHLAERRAEILYEQVDQVRRPLRAEAPQQRPAREGCVAKSFSETLLGCRAGRSGDATDGRFDKANRDRAWPPDLSRGKTSYRRPDDEDRAWFFR